MNDLSTLNPDAVKFIDDMSKWDIPLTPNDDLNFWKVAVGVVMRDATYIVDQQSSGCDFYIQIGVCSHWVRPHQTRWTANGGFAWPSGYKGLPHSCTGLPEFDWHGYLEWYPKRRSWLMTKYEMVADKRKYVLRVAIPARTIRHEQAVVNTVWLNGTPAAPRQKPMTFYGFRKVSDSWSLAAWKELDGRQWE